VAAGAPVDPNFAIGADRLVDFSLQRLLIKVPRQLTAVAGIILTHIGQVWVDL
jgi:hypothetical protein